MELYLRRAVYLPSLGDMFCGAFPYVNTLGMGSYCSTTLHEEGSFNLVQSEVVYSK